MKDDNYSCFYHEECFQIKYLYFKRHLDFITGIRQKGSKQNKALYYAILDYVQYHQVRSIQTLSFKKICHKQNSTKEKKATRKRSGIIENQNLCHKCYKNLQKNVLINHYFPVKGGKNVATSNKTL